jgi:hypothetical protein
MNIDAWITRVYADPYDMGYNDAYFRDRDLREESEAWEEIPPHIRRAYERGQAHAEYELSTGR